MSAYKYRFDGGVEFRRRRRRWRKFFWTEVALPSLSFSRFSLFHMSEILLKSNKTKVFLNSSLLRLVMMIESCNSILVMT